MTSETINSDKKKLAMEALERRFGFAKAERIREQKKDEKQCQENNVIPKNINVSPSSISLLSRQTTSKKGNISFVGHNTLQDAEAKGPTYFQLSHPVHENLVANKDNISSGLVSTVSSLLHELLEKGDSAQKYIHGSKSIKIDNCILLDNVVQGRNASFRGCIRALNRKSKSVKKNMSMKRNKRMGSHDLPQEFHKYDIFKPMHEMWKGYISQLLKHTGENQRLKCLLNADLHGAAIIVVHCKISAFTGISGLMIRETAETFGIITEDNKFRVVPKRISVFVFEVDSWKVTLRGDKLALRNWNS